MKTAITFLVALLLSLSFNGQTVSTITEGNFTDGLAIDSNGVVYGSDFSGTSIFKYDPASGEVSTFASGFVNPNGLGVSDADEVYICEAGGGTIHRYMTDGTLVTTYSELNNPTGIGFNSTTGLLYWVSYNISTIFTLNPSNGEIIEIYAGAPLNGPSGVAFVGNDVFFSNFNDRKIFKLEEDQTLTEIAQLPSIGPPNTDFLGFLAAKDGHLFGTHIGAHQIFRIDPNTGEFEVFAGIESKLGDTDGDLDMATFAQPNGIIGDPINDRIYVSDAAPNNLRIIDNASLSIDAFAKAKNQLLVFPNPTKDSLEIQALLPIASGYTLSIFNAAGKLLQKMTERRKQLLIETSINSSTWSRGVYIIKLTTEHEVLTKKIIK